MNDKKITYIGFGFGLLALAFSLWQSYELGYRYYAYRRTIATVRTIEIEKRFETDGEGGRHAVYRPKITREYSVEGMTFTGSTFSTGKENYFREREKAVALANRFKVGEPMTVFYDPRDVKRSFVVNGFDWARVGACLFFFVGGLAVMITSHVKIRDAAVAERRPGSF